MYVYEEFIGYIGIFNKVYLTRAITFDLWPCAGKFYNIGDQTGHGEDHCQFVDSFLDGQTGSQLLADQLPSRSGRVLGQILEPVRDICGKEP